MGRDASRRPAAPVPPGFNPRARVGRDASSRPSSRASCCFNPRARVGRDQRQLEVAVEVPAVSIHAPAWGATLGANYGATFDVVSIHAPAWGATRHACWCYCRHPVSIHAPAWGATPKRDGAFSEPFRFNPRARVGRDREDVEDDADELQFQSTRPRGARPWLYWDIPEYDLFQSTRPRGARHDAVNLKARYYVVSIHAPAWGATR